MRERFIKLAQEKRQVQVNFAAAAGGKLVSASGIIMEVGEDFVVMNDIYSNSMIIPFSSMAYIEIKK